MRKPSLSLLILVALAASTAQADTLHLKNGSLLKGKVTSFADDQFVVMLDTGSGRYSSKAMVYIGDVARIEFDSASVASNGGSDPGPSRETAAVARPVEPASTTSSPKETLPSDTTPVEAPPRNSSANETPTKNSPLVEPQPLSAQPKEPEPQPEKAVETTGVSAPSAVASDAPAPSEKDRLTRKLTAPAKTVSIDVVGKRDWTSSGLLVKRGDRIHITGTGAVTLDPVTGRVSGPEGVADLTDPKKLMVDQPSGGLIGVIGADNDDFIFIGRYAEFTAARDGLLFLSVNEGALADNTGTYKAVIEVHLQRK
jgi:sRNA-binding regulator protein Hfq